MTLGSRNKPWLEKSSQGDETKTTLNYKTLPLLVYLAGQLLRS
jgi:hypothetical protein